MSAVPTSSRKRRRMHPKRVNLSVGIFGFPKIEPSLLWEASQSFRQQHLGAADRLTVHPHGITHARLSAYPPRCKILTKDSEATKPTRFARMRKEVERYSKDLDTKQVQLSNLSTSSYQAAGFVTRCRSDNQFACLGHQSP